MLDDLPVAETMPRSLPDFEALVTGGNASRAAIDRSSATY
jgi:hypothetical protein